MAGIEVIKEMIDVMKDKNNEYCLKKVNEVEELLRQHMQTAEDSTDESFIFSVYIRKGNDIACNGYAHKYISRGEEYDKFMFLNMTKGNEIRYHLPVSDEE